MERLRGAAVAAAAVLVLAAAAEKTQDRPIRLGLVEKAGVELTLLDVEVTDKNGRPVPGLKKDDFAVTLNWKEWPVYSVDDLCSCEEVAPERPVDAPDATDPSAEAPHSAEPPPLRRPAALPTRFVLYFDFSQLQPDGRARAVLEAKRWLAESLKQGDEASIVTYGTDAGLVERCPFTSDRQKLIAAVDAGQNDPKQFESAAAFLPTRMCECGMYSSVCRLALENCPLYAVEEYFRSRRSLKAFREFLESLGESPGRKSVLYFNQNGVLHPGNLFGVGDEKGGDQTSLLDEVAGVAMTSRATVYPVFMGNELDRGAGVLNNAAVNFGANLADATGGRYNRGQIDLRSLLDTAARESCCIYRIGLRPPAGGARGVYQARVEAGGRKVGWLYRIQFENEMDRWLKGARAALRNPAAARELPLGAALVPIRAVGGRWTLSVQVAVDVDALAYLPVPEGREAQWQVGALLHREKKDASWEMLGVSSLHRKATVGTTAAVVHRRDFDGLRPGTYRLAAFVRDDNTGFIGGAEAVIDLPRPGSDGIAGPVVLRSPRKFLSAALPALAGKETKRSSVSELREDALPNLPAPIDPGESLEVETWVCGDADMARGAAPLRFISKGGVPQYRVEAASPRPLDGCLMYADSIDTSGLAAGTYAYHFRWGAPGRAEPREVTAAFEIGAAR